MGERARVVAYLRVSTEGQAEAGVSLDAQRAKVTAYAALYDLDLVAVIEDAGASAKTLSRPGLAEALRKLDAGEADGLLVAKLDRLTRSVRDLGALLDRGFRSRFALLSVAENVDTRSACCGPVYEMCMRSPELMSSGSPQLMWSRSA
jgi:DNA invertase Pin-like site-specific DNA recombinase